jgi:hypothetical protein
MPKPAVGCIRYIRRMSLVRTKPCILCVSCANAVRTNAAGKGARKCRAGIVMTRDMFTCDSYVRRFTYEAAPVWPLQAPLRRNIR